jgi:hypothetical protein
VGEQHGLHLGGIDVHAARDDHVGLTIAQEQVAVVVDVADVAHGEELAGTVRRGLVGIVVVVELPQRLTEVDEARHARWALVALLVDDPQHHAG